MRRTIALSALLLSCAVLAQEAERPRFSPYAPAQVIPASAASAGQADEAPAAKPARRAILPHQRRREGDIPGLVTMPYGKTAAGQRTHLYRVMGQGGVVADFTDYGARLVRLYLPDATGDLGNVLEGFLPSVVDREKAGDVVPVWEMTPIRRPRATGLAFELPALATNGVPAPRVTYWLDAENRLSVESAIAGTNAVAWADGIVFAPLGSRRVEVADASGVRTLSATTNAVSVSLRPGTNATERVELRFGR